MLAVQYGMGEESLAERIQQPVIVAKDLFRIFWQWSDGNVDYALLQSVSGQSLVGRSKWKAAQPRSLANFPMQANGAGV